MSALTSERMKRLNKLFSEFKSMIEREDFDNILVVCHASPDGDAVGSAWGLAHVLKSLGKKATAYCTDQPAKCFRVAGEVSLPEKVEHVITVDTASSAMLGDFPYLGLVDCAVDHHLVNTVSAPLKIVSSDSAACAEIIYSLALSLGFVPDEYFAECIYTGIATDTGCFKYSNVTAETFEIASALMRVVPRGFSELNKVLFDTSSMRKLRMEAYAVEHTELLYDGRAAFTAVTLEVKKSLEADHDDCDNIINIVRTIEGVEIALVAKEKEPGYFKVSVRSEDGFDAAAFCSLFGGGGHRKAAGCSLRGSVGEVRDALVKALGEALA